MISEFTADIDVKAGTVTFHMDRGAGVARTASLQNMPVEQDGRPGTGSNDTMELVTEWTGAVDGTGSVWGHDCGRRSSFCTAITVRSFFATELHDVYVEITEVNPTDHQGFASTALPAVTGGEVVSRTHGLWRYPTLLDRVRGQTVGTTYGANAATRVWYFDYYASQFFRVKGRILANEVPSTATGLQAWCGTAPTNLDTIDNCGECGRTAPAESTCTYTTTSGLYGGTSGLSFSVNCVSGTACDSTTDGAFECVDLQTSPQNCGACGNDCGTEQCVAGVCAARCADGETVCAIGGVKNMCCPPGSTCSGGACVLSDATEVSVGRDHACATTTSVRLAPAGPNEGARSPGTPVTSNNVVCWGADWFGTNGTKRAQPVPEFYPYNIGGGYQLREDMWKLVSGDTINVALSKAGAGGETSSYTWGSSGSNLIDGWPSQAFQVVVGANHGCGPFDLGFDGGGFGGIWCFGSNEFGQAGNDNPGATPCAHNGCFVSAPAPQGTVFSFNPRQGLVAKSLAAGGDTTCAIIKGVDGAPAGGVACWGDDTAGQAGGPDSDPDVNGFRSRSNGVDFYRVPHLIGLDPVLQVPAAISVGGRHVVALLESGRLAFWGDNSHGQFGVAASSAPGAVIEVDPGRPVNGVTAGQEFTCYLSGGTVYCAGLNDHGQLGDGTAAGSSSTFLAVPGIAGATAVSAGGVAGHPNAALGSACALVGGQVLCWGDNSAGQLGYGSDGLFNPIPQNVLLQPDAPLP